ncbi:hypothetical protein LTR64_004794 [Lithohypha guttulata]|uniref:uncharacterized protein n=1 Tax=Lithohypha guttulata TaxID=1690604 RepID=UPI002DDF6357|nr:hypothetical protein LTR51_005373 [Lithohypha guttulata]
MASTIDYKAKHGDTLEKIAAAAGVYPSVIIDLNKDLQNGQEIRANKIYKLPRSATSNSAMAISDLLVEYNARKREAGGG